METPQKKLLTYGEIRTRLRTHALRQAEIPIEHAISLPLPTRRWVGPAYALFASPALRRPNQPVEQGSPDRWWVLDAHGGRTLIYALWKAQPYAERVSWDTVQLPPLAGDKAELRQALADMERLLEALAPAFFAGEAGDMEQRKALAALLQKYLPAPLLPQYRALTPDFFTWLEAS